VRIAPARGSPCDCQRWRGRHGPRRGAVSFRESRPRSSAMLETRGSPAANFREGRSTATSLGRGLESLRRFARLHPPAARAVWPTPARAPNARAGSHQRAKSQQDGSAKNQTLRHRSCRAAAAPSAAAAVGSEQETQSRDVEPSASLTRVARRSSDLSMVDDHGRLLKARRGEVGAADDRRTSTTRESATS
jgi:hypothetical protein